MAATRVALARTADGDVQLVVGRDSNFVVTILDENGALKDLTSDTIACTVAYANGDKDTWTLTARANQTTTGKGLADLQAPAAELTSARASDSTPVKVDIVWNNSVLKLADIYLRANDTV